MVNPEILNLTESGWAGSAAACAAKVSCAMSAATVISFDILSPFVDVGRRARYTSFTVRRDWQRKTECYATFISLTAFRPRFVCGRPELLSLIVTVRSGCSRRDRALSELPPLAVAISESWIFSNIFMSLKITNSLWCNIPMSGVFVHKPNCLGQRVVEERPDGVLCCIAL